VHEAYLRLIGQRTLDWQNRAHVLALAARMMRRILANHAIARNRLKRGGNTRHEDAPHLALDQALDFYDRREISLAAVDEALRDLESLDARQAQIVELRFFGGLKIEEVAEVLAISPATVKREWLTAKLWLQREIAGGA
jgi:RNA polymerase sigma-70 factor (ECF subfamily)